jgi:hypothetical protein
MHFVHGRALVHQIHCHIAIAWDSFSPPEFFLSRNKHKLFSPVFQKRCFAAYDALAFMRNVKIPIHKYLAKMIVLLDELSQQFSGVTYDDYSSWERRTEMAWISI